MLIIGLLLIAVVLLGRGGVLGLAKAAWSNVRGGPRP